MAGGAHVALLVGWQRSLQGTALSSWLTPIAAEALRPEQVLMQLRPIALARAAPTTVTPAPRPATATRTDRPAGRPPEVAAAAPASATRDSGAAAPAIAPTPVVAAAPAAGRSPLRPSYGSGQLWVRPLPMSPREIAATLAGKSMDQVADSLVAVMVQQYLDALAAERANPANRPPSWTTNIGGKKVGIDGQWIYIGPIKLPTALLALLPINLQGNPTQAEMNKRLNAMREDLFFAARRAATMEEFKKNVAELRKQKQYEYDIRKAQRTLPDTGRP